MHTITRAACGLLLGTFTAATLAAPGGPRTGQGPQLPEAAQRASNAHNSLPAFISGDIIKRSFDGVSDDLLTAGLGASGLASPAAPQPVDPNDPTAEELRRLAIYNNYRALVPTGDGNGYGVFFGPQVGADGEGRIAGHEWLAYMDFGGGDRVVAMVQVPASFDRDNACMVTAPSSGSRGIYGAIGTAGEWGLKRGCAVVYTDKGKGIGAHALGSDAAYGLDGRPTAGDDAHFRAPLSAAERAAYAAANPDRFAFKHAHSQQNPEQNWGRDVLRSIEFGFYVLNELHGKRNPAGHTFRTLRPANTLVIASSVSNGGGASLLAAEQDSEGLIDGIAVSEPNVNPVVDRGFSIRQGDAQPITEHSRSLFDYTTALALYQGCANVAFGVGSAVNENICGVLASKGLISGDTPAAQAIDALRILNQEFAIQPEQNPLAWLNYNINVPQGIAVTYANAYGRFSVTDNLCGFSFAHSDAEGRPAPLPAASAAQLFATGNGIPPTGGVNVIYNDAQGGPTEMSLAVSPSHGVADYALEGFLCLRALAAGADPVTGEALTGERLVQAQAIADGVAAIRAGGDLGGRPAVIVNGRADQILPINHTSRPYYGLNRRVEGDQSRLRYYEVLNAQHLDILNDLPGFNEAYVPLHRYYFQALDLVYEHLRNGTPLPPSQVVRTIPRGAELAPLSEANVPPISAQPASTDRVALEGDVLRIPD